MHIARATLAEPLAGADVAVVIDVLRTGTTLAYAFLAGARAVVVADGPEEALRLRSALPDAITIGEADPPSPDFELPNAPSLLGPSRVGGATLVLWTRRGAPGLLGAAGAKLVLAGAFSNATATVRRIREAAPRRVRLVITGACDTDDADEDVACADYLAMLLNGRRPDPAPFQDRVRRSHFGRSFGDPAWPGNLPLDLELCTRLDAAPFALEAVWHDGLLVVSPSGHAA